MKTGTPQTSLNFKACGSSPATHPHKELVTPYLHPQGSKWHWSPPSRVPRKLLSQEAEELATLICCGTHSTTSRRAQEPWEEVVTYCSATKQSEVTTQHRLSSPGLVMEETDDTSFPPFPLPRDCSRGHKVVLSGQKPGAMTRVATAQEARSTEWGR